MDRQAVRLLRSLGYADVRAYTPGLAGWIDAGGPVETGGGPAPAPTPPAASADLPRDATPPRRDRWLERLDRVVALPARSLLGLWLAIILAFGLVYWLPTLFGLVTLAASGRPVPATLEGLWTSLYFSFVTGLSVGYGDVVPVGLMRVPAVIEGAADLLLFGFVVSKFMSRRQDMLLEQLHHTAFDERLGRVRTNLHLVLSEFEAVADDCRGESVATSPAAARVLVRAESAALIFAGELRTIHELLYRPAEAPDPAALEGILASLAANLEALRDLLACLAPESLRSPVLQKHLQTTTALAEEICGDCVPHALGEELRVWMDRVRELARTLLGGAPAAP